MVSGREWSSYWDCAVNLVILVDGDGDGACYIDCCCSGCDEPYCWDIPGLPIDCCECNCC